MRRPQTRSSRRNWRRPPSSFPRSRCQARRTWSSSVPGSGPAMASSRSTETSTYPVIPSLMLAPLSWISCPISAGGGPGTPATRLGSEDGRYRCHRTSLCCRSGSRRPADLQVSHLLADPALGTSGHRRSLRQLADDSRLRIVGRYPPVVDPPNEITYLRPDSEPWIIVRPSRVPDVHHFLSNAEPLRLLGFAFADVWLTPRGSAWKAILILAVLGFRLAEL